jgi:hypothetical protein
VCALVNDGSSGEGGAANESGPSQAYMGGAARRVSAPLLGARSFSHAQKPPTNKAEGAAKEEDVGAMHDAEPKPRVLDVKEHG